MSDLRTEEDADRERGIALATEALHAAMREDWPAMAETVTALSGSHALIWAVMAWCDTLIARWPGGLEAAGQPVLLGWLEDGRGPVQSAQDVPAPARWAGQVTAARAALDQDAFFALLRAPAEGSDLGDCVQALVTSAALAVQEAVR